MPLLPVGARQSTGAYLFLGDQPGYQSSGRIPDRALRHEVVIKSVR